MKKKFLRSYIAIGLALTMASSLIGCSKKGSDNTANDAATSDNAGAADPANSADSGKPDTWIADRTITIQAYVDDIGNTLPEDLANTEVMKEITKRTGIKLNIQYTPGDSDAAVMASQLASGSIPDVIVSYLNNSTRPEFPILLKAAKEGMFADVSSYMKDSKVYSKYLEDGYLPDDAKDNITFRKDFDGKAYLMQLYIPRVDRSTEYDPNNAYIGGMYIQKRIVDDLGIDPTQIRTEDQLYDLLVKIKNAGYKDDNGNPVYPLGPKYWGGSVDALTFITSEYNWGVSDGYNITDDGTIMHEAETDYVYKKINFVRKLLAEDLINPEFFTMDATRAKEVSETHNSAIIGDVHNYMDIIYNNEDWVPLGPLNDFTGSNTGIAHGKSGYGAWAISADAKNPEEIFKFFDYLSSTEGQLLCEYGIEGENYTMVDGKPVLTDDTLQKLNDGDTDYLINKVGASFGGSGCVFFDYVLTDVDLLADFGESRPGAGSGTKYQRSVEIAKEYPRTYKLVKGLDATAYLSEENMADVKAQMDLLNYKEMIVQAIYAKSDDEVKSIVESFRQQLKSAGLDKFKEYLTQLYKENPTAIDFYTK